RVPVLLSRRFGQLAPRYEVRVDLLLVVAYLAVPPAALRPLGHPTLVLVNGQGLHLRLAQLDRGEPGRARGDGAAGPARVVREVLGLRAVGRFELLVELVPRDRGWAGTGRAGLRHVALVNGPGQAGGVQVPLVDGLGQFADRLAVLHDQIAGRVGHI